MVRAVGDVESRPVPAQENGSHESEVGQVCAAVERVIQDYGVALPELVESDRAHYGAGHGAEVDGYVRGLGDEFGVSVEDGA